MPHPSLRRGPMPRRFDHGEPIRAIDTRPMLFVALFIAVVFLLVASQTRQHALLVELPQPEAGLIETNRPPVLHRIRIAASGKVMFDGMWVDDAKLEKLLERVKANEPRAVLAYEPDGSASYERSAQTLAMIYRAGLVDDQFCIDGMEKHREPDGYRGHPLPLLTSIWVDEALSAKPMVPPPDIDTCAPEIIETTGR
jgi:biopolymer transport protein ExbD